MLPHITRSFIPLVPLFLSPSITSVSLAFAYDPSEAADFAPVIKTLPTLCPNLRKIKLSQLPRDPMITAAVSEIPLVANRNILQQFHVGSPLTEEASEVVYKLPNLRDLWVNVNGSGSLPTFVLPNLTTIVIEYNGGHGWLQGFHGATLGKLTSITFLTGSSEIGDFLEAFKSVALTTSITETLSEFVFYTMQPWRPNCRSLLPFTQLKELTLQFSCGDGCSSTIDDSIITDLAQAMPKLEILRLGARPCQTPAGVTIKGLTALAHHCLRLSQLCIHFQITSLDLPVIPQVAPAVESTTPQEYCALMDLEVGNIPISEESASMVALALLRIFPRLHFIRCDRLRWMKVMGAIRVSKKLANRSSKSHPFSTL